MMKPRATTHAGKGSVKHNFREFPKEAKGNSDINRNLSNENRFFLNGKYFNSQSELQQYLDKNISVFNKQTERFKDDRRYKDLSLSEKFELLYYEKLFGETINNQHDRNAKRRQQCLDKNAIDMLISQKTQPEETIYQIGDSKNYPGAVTADELWGIYLDYKKKHNSRFGTQIKVLDASLHVDETSCHIHERKVYVGVNSHNESYPSKDSALALLGIERPDMTKSKSRYNNRKQTYSAECRQMWLDTCIEHGLDIETIPKEYGDKKGLKTMEFKVSQEEAKLQVVKGEINNSTNKLMSLNLEINKANNTYKNSKQANDELEQIIQKNNMLLLSQNSTIETSRETLKKINTQKQFSQNEIEQLTQKMIGLCDQYANGYNELDKLDFIINKVKDEYPDYFNELVTEFENQTYVHEYDSIER